MGKLEVLTFADQALSEDNYLKKSCAAMKIPLQVLISSPWVQNVIKLKMLWEYVDQVDPDLILLVVDAYDVVVYENEKEILSKFENARADILFSGESNFMYKEPAKWLSFLRKYPSQPTIYQFLNSGSYIGKAKHIQEMLMEMQRRFELDLQNEEQLLPIRSDQYLLSRFYVENDLEPGKLNLKIDSQHLLLGCTGGRFCVINFPDVTKWQSFTFFILERNILKLFSLHKHQKLPKDYHPDQGLFYNKKTKTRPSVMHFPGTWDRFDKVYEELFAGTPPRRRGTWLIASLISLAGFTISIFVGPIFWLLSNMKS